MNHFAAHLASFSALQSLDLSSNGIDEHGVQTLAPFVAQLTALHTLDLNYNRICGEGMPPASFLCLNTLMSDVGPAVDTICWGLGPEGCLFLHLGRCLVMGSVHDFVHSQLLRRPDHRSRDGRPVSGPTSTPI